jgi:hypothetical protein
MSSDEEPLFDASPPSSNPRPSSPLDEPLFECQPASERAQARRPSWVGHDTEPEPEPEAANPERAASRDQLQHSGAGAVPEGVPPESRSLARRAAASGNSAHQPDTGLDTQTLRTKLHSSAKALEFFERAGEERGVAQMKADIAELETAIAAKGGVGDSDETEQDIAVEAGWTHDGWKPLSCILARPMGEVPLYLTGSTASGARVAFRVDWRMSNIRLDGGAGSPPHPAAGGLQLWRLTDRGQLICKSAPDLCVTVDRNSHDEGSVLVLLPAKEVPPAPLTSGDSGWQQDAAAPKCNACQRRFSLTLWQHHCRQCGQIFCDDCSARRHTLGELVDARVCVKCKEMLVLEPKNQLWNCRTAMEGDAVVTVITSQLHGMRLARGESVGSGLEIPDSYSCAATVRWPSAGLSPLQGW